MSEGSISQQILSSELRSYIYIAAVVDRLLLEDIC